MKKIFILLLPALCFLSSCQPETKKDEKTAFENMVQYFVWQENTPVRNMPSLEGNIVTRLEKGASVYYIGEVSNALTVMTLDSVTYCEPWLRVKLAQGLEGWIFGGAIDNKSEKDIYLDARTTALVGGELKDSIDLLLETVNGIPDPESFENVYHQAEKLQAQINQRLEQISYDLAGPSGLPDLFWLAEAIPGFVPQIVAEGTSYYLFFDYRQWLAWAQKTPEGEDDAFISICTSIFPSDSIEYFFPAWTIQTWDYGGHSLLGRGIHRDILDQLNSYQSKTPLFAMEVNDFRQRIMDDITLAEVTYWEDAIKIKAELDSIIAQNYQILTEADRVGLTVRRDQFENPQRYNIQLHIRAGE